MELNLAHVFPWEQQQPEDKHRSQVEDVRAAEDANRDLRTQTEGSTITLVNPDEHTNGVVVAKSSKDSIAGMTADDETVSQPDSLVNQEHLQLTIEEAFFLTYGLGVLDIRNSEQSKSISTPDLFNICRRHSYFPPVSITQLRPDDPFLLNYAVYHYYRSLGWVVRPGVKFSVDYLLYNRGPVFSHAEFAIMIIPEYSSEVPESEKRGTKDWWWLHCVNRVQSQVRKSLVVCYVEVPKSLPDQGSEVDIGAIFRQYKVREFVVRRWLANRSRD
ncbi:hypothetical protein BT93_L5668 [Corymbia citriodora subsp. variegata]|uniref:tRNA-splicing endonuclease subunit Sen2 n=1 Tax=Corymbia citriodora subsp. variegata TaxID=360336 RepID=A0A8T0CIQ5_CORYI|nr:hypothetical protein BT93_L5668 [Corymbia citriodora subsp. variegata]